MGEWKEYKVAEIIEEFLHQRIKGFKNEKGVYITPAFPKLLYVLEEEGVIMFSVSPVTISYDGKSYVIVSSASEASFSISDVLSLKSA